MRHPLCIVTLSASCLAALALVLTPAPAHACGGLFCDAAQPVNQAAERIIFSAEDDGTVTAVIQIQYAGPSDRFAWLLPVQGSPAVSVSSNVAFQRLQTATNPQYTMNTRVEGECHMPRFADGGGAFGGADASGGAADAGGGAVSVVDQGQAGPYDYVTISVDPAAPDAAQAAIDWLVMNAFDVDDFGGDVLRPYLEAGMNLIAFRLTKGNDTGSIRPVVLSFGQGLASIPIRPTAVATTPDMGVMLWFLGDHRAIPANYRSLELNEALINWFNPNSNYNDVVIRAADEAGGQGFVTELSAPAGDYAGSIFADFERDAWNFLLEEDWTNREGELLSTTVQSFGAFDGMADVFEETVPVPDGVMIQDLLSCPGCYYDWSTPDIDGFDPATFLEAVRTDVIEPMATTRALFEAAPTVTRLYTTMSAEDMTVDPVFDQNPDLPAVSNQHVAERVIECSPNVLRGDAPWRVTLPNGDVVRGAGSTWPIATDEAALDANLRVLRLGNTGTGEVIEDNQAATDAYLAALEPPPVPTVGGDGCCSVGPGPTDTPGALLAGLALLGLVIRRRRGR